MIHAISFLQVTGIECRWLMVNFSAIYNAITIGVCLNSAMYSDLGSSSCKIMLTARERQT